MEAETYEGLPDPSSMSSSLKALLNQEFKNLSDLANAPAVLARLSGDLQSCEDRLALLHSSLSAKLAAWVSYSRCTSSSLSSLGIKLQEFTAQTPSPAPAVAANTGKDKDFVGQLPLLAAEVARVERVRLYAETALRLESLVGDLEDAVASVVIGTPRIKLPRKMANSPDPNMLVDLSRKFSNATTALQMIEDVIVATSSSWPQWKRMIMAVDNRVDNTLVSLRPSALADYRLKLTLIGWPPTLVAVSQEGDQRDVQFDHPLLKLHGETKERFEESFVSLSTLQALQCRRKARQAVRGESHVTLTAHNHELLWTFEELVAPIGSRAANHFLKWSDKPDLIFGLAYRVAQKHTQIVDAVLQPMLDKVRLPGYCAREEWVSALVTMVMHHLRTHMLPELADTLLEDATAQDASSLWLHIVDLAISFDKKMRALALQSGISSASKLELDMFEESVTEFHSIAKCISVFAEREEWLELWIQFELADAQGKLDSELRQESLWLRRDPSAALLRSAMLLSDVGYRDDRHPPAAEAAMLKMWALINRCRSLPRRDWQLAFITNVGPPFMRAFVTNMLQRCQEAEVLTALADDGAITKVALCINAACFCENKLQEWSEDIFFLDLRRVQLASADYENVKNMDRKILPLQGGLFDDEIASLGQFRMEWVQKLVSALQRAFDASCQDYQHNKKRWQEENGSTLAATDLSISSSLVDGLGLLQLRLRMLNELLADGPFVDLWRALASSLDQFLLNAVVLGGARFSIAGSRQLVKDIEAVFHVFKPFCVRPASFFPNLGDAALLLALPLEDVQRLQKSLLPASKWRFRDGADDENGSKSLKEYGVRWVSSGRAGRQTLCCLTMVRSRDVFLGVETVFVTCITSGMANSWLFFSSQRLENDIQELCHPPINLVTPHFVMGFLKV